MLDWFWLKEYGVVIVDDMRDVWTHMAPTTVSFYKYILFSYISVRLIHNLESSSTDLF